MDLCTTLLRAEAGMRLGGDAKRVEGEVLLAPVDTTAHDSQELPIEVALDRPAFVWREDPNLMEFAGLHQDGVVIRVQVCLVADVTVAGRVEVLGVPDGTAVAEVVGEQDANVAIERDIDPATPATATPREQAALGSKPCFGVQSSSMLGAVSTMRLPL